MGFKNKTVLVLGGNRRIACAVSLAMVYQKARVIILSEDDTAINENIAEIEIFNIINNPLKKVIQKIKSVDILINYRDTTLDSPSETEEKIPVPSGLRQFRDCIEAVIPVMSGQGYGKIINLGDSPVRGAGRYLSLKNEIIQFTKTLGRTLAKENIAVNAVIPGPIEGEDYRQAQEDIAVELKHYFPIKRKAAMEEIVEPVLFLSSDKSGYIFGQTIIVDGGFTA